MTTIANKIEAAIVAIVVWILVVIFLAGTVLIDRMMKENKAAALPETTNTTQTVRGHDWATVINVHPMSGYKTDSLGEAVGGRWESLQCISTEGA